MKIGFIGALTGPLSASGIDALYGLKAGVQYLNQQGGKYHYTIVSRDSQGNPTKAVAATIQITQGHGVAGIYYTTESFPPAQVALNRSQTPGFSPGINAILPQARTSGQDPWAFSPGTQAGSPSVAQQVNFALSSGKVIGELYEASAYGQAQAALTKTEVAKHPGAKLVSQSFATGSTDMSKQLQQLKSAGAQSVIVWTYGAGMVSAMTSFQRVGWYPKVAGPLAMADPATDSAAPKAVLAAAVGGPLPTTFLSATPDTPAKGLAGEFVKHYEALAGSKTFNGLDEVGAFSFDTALIIASAINKTGSTNGLAMRNSLTSGAPFVGAQGTYRFTPNTRLGLANDQLGMFKANQPCPKGTCVTAG